jgi:hypothetical protein
LSKPIFDHLHTELLSVVHEGRCSDGKISNACQLCHDICMMLDLVASKFRLKNGEPREEDYQTLE